MGRGTPSEVPLSCAHCGSDVRVAWHQLASSINTTQQLPSTSRIHTSSLHVYLRNDIPLNTTRPRVVYAKTFVGRWWIPLFMRLARTPRQPVEANVMNVGRIVSPICGRHHLPGETQVRSLVPGPAVHATSSTIRSPVRGFCGPPATRAGHLAELDGDGTYGRTGAAWHSR